MYTEITWLAKGEEFCFGNAQLNFCETLLSPLLFQCKQFNCILKGIPSVKIWKIISLVVFLILSKKNRQHYGLKMFSVGQGRIRMNIEEKCYLFFLIKKRKRQRKQNSLEKLPESKKYVLGISLAVTPFFLAKWNRF